MNNFKKYFFVTALVLFFISNGKYAFAETSGAAGILQLFGLPATVFIPKGNSLLVVPVEFPANFKFNGNLKYGMSGGDVTMIQKFLKANGFLKAEPTGFFYSQTLKAIKDFQKSYGIPDTGFVGSMTRQKINELMAASASQMKAASTTQVFPSAASSSK